MPGFSLQSQTFAVVASSEGLASWSLDSGVSGDGDSSPKKMLEFHGKLLQGYNLVGTDRHLTRPQESTPGPINCPKEKTYMSPNYVVVTPVRDEEEHLPHTIASMVAQTVKPTQWAIVNDGSSDGTGAIIDAAAAEHPWITPVHRPDRGYRKAGGGVMEAVNAGMDALETDTWDYFIKLDGDLSFEPEYFQRCFEEFDADPQLGVGGGVIFHIFGGREKIEKHPNFHVRGATKIYRRACWDDIAPLLVAPGWDTMDEVKANMKGWRTGSFHHLKLQQHRFTGNAEGQLKNFIKNGRASYISGYHPLWILAKCGVRAFRKPYLTASFGLFWGFFSSYFRKVEQIDDRALISYVRSQQLRRLFFRKSIWR